MEYGRLTAEFMDIQQFYSQELEISRKSKLKMTVQATIRGIRERFWIPKLRSAIKNIIYNCNLCKRYYKRPLKPSATGRLPRFCRELGEPFQTTRINFSGPLLYKDRDQKMKGYVVTFTSAATRAMHLKLSKSMLTEKLKCTLEEFIARRRTPRTIISDNTKTFKAASNWLKTIVHNDSFLNFVNLHRIEWKFANLRAP